MCCIHRSVVPLRRASQTDLLDHLIALSTGRAGGAAPAKEHDHAHAKRNARQTTPNSRPTRADEATI